VTLSIHRAPEVREGWSPAETCKRLADAGADVVGLNCIRGPATMMPLLREIRAAVRTPVAALPVPYRTHADEPSFQSLRDPHWHGPAGSRPFPVALDPFTCNRFEIADFGREALALGVRYLGVCCGAGPHHIRALAEAVGKRPPGSKYSPDMSKHAFLGTHERIRQVQKDYAGKL
jgi:betaine-homocysteine S-methyltransferase